MCRKQRAIFQLRPCNPPLFFPPLMLSQSQFPNLSDPATYGHVLGMGSSCEKSPPQIHVCVCVCVCMRDREVGVGQRGEMEWEENKRMKEWHPPAGLSWGCKVSFLGRFSFPVPFSAVHRDSPVL